jgi:hypothetical membrane protein
VSSRPQQQRVTRALLACGAVGAPLFVVVLLIEGATRPGYSPMRHPGSLLSLGDRGWVQITNFLVTGLLMLAFAVGLRRALDSGPGSRWGPVLLAGFGSGLLAAGVFVADPLLGYPPGTPSSPDANVSWHGTLHNFAGLVAFASLSAACFVLARRFAAQSTGRGWAVYCAVTGVAIVACFVAASAAFSQQVNALAELGGLFQRAAIVLGWGWVALLATRLLATLAHQGASVPVSEGSVKGP